MRLIILLSTVLLLQSSFAQDKVVYFSDAIKSNIKKYNSQSDKAYRQGDIEAGQALFDSLVQNKLVGSKFDDYSFKSVNSRKVKLSKIKKPVFIITYSSWCVIPKGEIQALNKLARKYDDQVQFIAVFWDTKTDTRKIARKFNHKIKVCYANESYKNDARIVATLKHTLGFPTSYYLNSNLEVVDIKRGGIQLPPSTNAKTAFDMNYRLFNERLSIFLEKQQTPVSQLASVAE
ncbi:TlpA family protein disulfide reductase [Flavobacterium caeni]|uniref:Thiol-disulfide isomerase or thioredoxin n=1 Tax=Flavobacterium caeni TaxID=490189 RepID=A0A1G5HPN2_9FLAO|nr:redoxin domain-containing protein [Flavobacterium caeni]SCY65409.1 Thiol-disulfide isomerase or thioredoxin [Flavobacterium caeni]